MLSMQAWLGNHLPIKHMECMIIKQQQHLDHTNDFVDASPNS